MQPNDYIQPTPSGIDYLNQIAPPEQPKGVDKKMKILLVVAGFFLLFGLILIFLMATDTSSSSSPLKLAARLQKLQVVTDKYTDKLRDSDLQTVNSSFSAVLTTANQSINQLLPKYDIDPKKQAKEIIAVDPSTKIEQNLDDTFLTYGTIDSAYVMEMNVQLEDTLLMMKQMQRDKQFSDMHEFLAKTITDFENIQKRFGIDEQPTTDQTPVDN